MSQWLQNEKVKLLLALKKYGAVDLEAVANEIPFKSLLEVKAMIEKYETKASKNVSNISGSPLGMWIDAVTKKTNHTVLDPVTRALKYIMLFEPEHEIIDGINLRDCYELLYSLSEGKPTKVLNEKTKDFLNYTLTMLARDLQQEDLKPEKDYLHSNSFINNLSNGKRTYAMRDSVQGNSDLDCSINPLQIPENLFKKSKTSES